jgi:hypothetical protein
MDVTIGSDPERSGEELLHVLANPGVAVPIILHPIGRQPIDDRTDIIWPRVGGRCVDEPEGPLPVKTIGVAKVAGDEAVALFVGDPLDHEVLLSAVATERQREQTL